ncbi:MAG: universal stress protein [Pseudomonadota bacterium]
MSIEGNTCQHPDMVTKTQRRSFEAGHTRKFLVIVDESPEVDAALFFAASRCQHTSGSLQLLYVIQPQAFQHWMGVRQVQLEEETNKAKALFRLFRRKLSNEGFDDIVVEDCLREGSLTDQILEQIDQDEDVAVLVLGAAPGKQGPGPLVSSLAAGTQAATFPIPITIVPGDLTLDELRAMA